MSAAALSKMAATRPSRALAAATAQATRKLLVSRIAVLAVPIAIRVWRAAAAKSAG